MSKTPYQTSSGLVVAITVHLPAVILRWLTEAATTRQSNMTAVAAEIAEDRRSLFGLPEQQRRLIQAEQRALGLSMRDEIRYVLWARYREVRKKGIAFDQAEVPKVLAETAGKKK